MLGAFQNLIDWHEAWYSANEPEKWTKGRAPALVITDKGETKLTTAEKKRILTNNIFGVDIDAQAVEVTKLSLLLKVLEEESGQLSLGFERVLPDLGENIQCGNSLIGWDYFQGQLLPNEEETLRVNPFSWERSFAEVFAEGGFDAVIGNPPYIRIQSMREWAPNDVEHYRKMYPSAQSGNFDIYVIFVEKGLRLLNETGLLGFILPHKFFQAAFAKPIREVISKGKHIRKIVHFGAEQVFEEATTYTCLLFLSKAANDEFDFLTTKKPEDIGKDQPVKDGETTEQARLNAPEAGPAEWEFSASKANTVLETLRKQSLSLGDVTSKIFVGLQTSADKIYVLQKLEVKEESVVCYSKALEREVEIEKGLLRPFLMGKDVHRYEALEAKNYVIFPYRLDGKAAELMTGVYIKKNFPMGWDYLLLNKKALGNRERGRMVGDRFYAYIYPKNLAEFDQAKILTPEISFGCNISYDREGIFYHTTKVYSFVFKPTRKERPEYWLGLLNSKVLWFFIKATGYTLRGGYFTFKTNYLNPFPVVGIDFENIRATKQHERMVELVTEMLRQKSVLCLTPVEKEQTKRRINGLENEIDALVYELYGLSDEEIRLVEENEE